MGVRRLKVLGTHLRPLDTKPRVGAALGLSRSATYRAEIEWPMAGNRVVVPALLDRLGIPYEIEGTDDE